jgi:hypothetical protein
MENAVDLDKILDECLDECLEEKNKKELDDILTEQITLDNIYEYYSKVFKKPVEYLKREFKKVGVETQEDHVRVLDSLVREDGIEELKLMLQYVKN